MLLAKSNLRSLKIATAPYVILIEDVQETTDVWRKIFSEHKIDYKYFGSYKEFKNFMESTNHNPFSSKKFTLITDLIFEEEDQTGLDAIQLVKDKDKFLLNAFLCTTLSSNEEIIKIARDQGVQIFGKKDLDKIQISII